MPFIMDVSNEHFISSLSDPCVNYRCSYEGKNERKVFLCDRKGVHRELGISVAVTSDSLRELSLSSKNNKPSDNWMEIDSNCMRVTGIQIYALKLGQHPQANLATISSVHEDHKKVHGVAKVGTAKLTTMFRMFLKVSDTSLKSTLAYDSH